MAIGGEPPWRMKLRRAVGFPFLDMTVSDQGLMPQKSGAGCRVAESPFIGDGFFDCQTSADGSWWWDEHATQRLRRHSDVRVRA